MSDLPEGWDERLAELQRRADRAQFDQIVTDQTFTGDIAAGGPRVPLPGECHPFYARHRLILKWLDDRYAGARLNVLAPPPLQLFGPPYDEPPDISQDTITLTRRTYYGAAPYVGRPFVYTWHAAVDELGRAVATDAHIRYTQWADDREATR